MTMARKFKLPEMPCQLGSKFTSNGEGEGEKREDLVKFSLEGLMLTAKSLDKILGADAAAHLFLRQGGDAIVPRFGDDVNELKLAHRYTDSTATLDLDGTTLTLPKSKFMNIAAQRQNGGNTLIELDVETPADLVDGVTDIGNFGGRKIRAQLAFGEKAGADSRQPELPMDHDEDEEPAEKPRGKKGNGSQVHA
jgi:hypothetical protein